ncbi:protein FAR1-RELATED SEQUENCE [Citrus sinensis]|uniref:Protein FAR1-RELATED SEQUENCE n=1 Tax=Citrus sinensis TaxID=2711 RepID=A0ACB8KGC3_CITSI|nr:protein FAR1-RELATED SEQUENCE [Citrus sinensis]
MEEQNNIDNHKQDDVSIKSTNYDTDCVMDYSSEFTTHEIFKSREAMIQWTRNVGKKNGIMVVIKRSEVGRGGKRARIFFGCERGGKYEKIKKKDNQKDLKSRITGTKKCGCPFKLKGQKLDTHSDWMLKVMCGVHNHPIAKHLEGHSFAGRLTAEETSILVDMSKNMVRPKDILVTLKKKDPFNVSTMKSIYNARQRYKVIEMAGRSQMQQLLSKLSEHNYIEWHRCYDNTDIVKDLFWAHPKSIELLRSFPSVLLMDCTYKVNKYHLPLFEIIGVTSTDMTFNVAYTYLSSEREDSYTWALDRLRGLMDNDFLPRVIVTDRELALMNAIEKIFPRANHFLCRWHISRNIMANCKKLFAANDKWEKFIMSWNLLVLSSNEIEFIDHFKTMQRDFASFPAVMEYVTNAWLNNYKERFVSAWTDKIMHFGNLTTNRVESSHSRLKKYLSTSQGNFETSWAKIHNLLELQHTDIKASFEKSLTVVQHQFKPTEFKHIRGFISITALNITLSELKRAISIGVDRSACGCVIRQTHGLPCAHEIAEYKREFAVTQKQKVELSCQPEFELIANRFNESSIEIQLDILKKLKEIANPGCTFLLDPEVKTRTRGRPSIKVDTSTRRDPSAFEISLSGQESCSLNVKSNSVTTAKSKAEVKRRGRPKTKSTPVKSITFIDEFLVGLQSYIHHIKDVVADGNCGFRAIADLIGLGEDGWVQVRKDLLNELYSHLDDYGKLYGPERVNELIHILSYYENWPASSDRWMTMPDMGHLIASCYNVVLFHLSSVQCLTFLPLRSEPVHILSRRNIALGYVFGNHFVEVFLTPGHPIPPITLDWGTYHHPIANGWETSYASQIQHFREIISPKVATIDRIILDN